MLMNSHRSSLINNSEVYVVIWEIVEDFLI